MKNKKILVLVTALLAFLGVACDREASVDSLAGVWEGPMTVNGSDVHVKILNIKGKSAEMYEMKYTFDGYEIVGKQVSSVEMLSRQKGQPSTFQLSFDGKACGYFHEDDIIGETESEEGCLFKLTGNKMDYYRNGMAAVPGLLPKDKEYTGPSKYVGKATLLSGESLSLEWTDLLLWAGETMAKSAASMAATEFLKAIFKDDSAASASLDDVLGRIDEIKDMLNTMITLYKNTVYEGKLNERSKLQYEMHNHNKEAYTLLKYAENQEQADAAIMNWAEKTVGGNPAYEQALNYMNFLQQTVIEQKDIFNMYDLYTYNTTAWEHQGYAYREALRMGDIATAAEGMFLTQYYYMIKPGISDEARKKFLADNADSFAKFCEFVKKHPVEHHDNMAICQIPDAHFVMEKQSISYPDFRNPSWCRLPARWTRYDSDEYFMWGPNQVENYSQAIKIEELTAIMQYYGGQKTVYEILVDEAGCEMISSTKPGSGKRAAVCLQGGYYPGDWREIGLERVVLTSASYPYEIEPLSAGKAIIDGAGIFAQYLQFYSWDKYYDDIVWIRTKVVER